MNTTNTTVYNANQHEGVVSDLNLAATKKRPVARIAVRVTHNREEDRNLCIESQIKAGRSYCNFKQFALDLDASAAYQDKDESDTCNTWRARPGIMAHYEAAKRNEFQHLVFFKLSCLGRNAQDVSDLIAAFDREGVTVHTVSEQIDCSTPTGCFLQSILVAVAGMRSEDTAEFMPPLPVTCAQTEKGAKP